MNRPEQGKDGRWNWTASRSRKRVRPGWPRGRRHDARRAGHFSPRLRLGFADDGTELFVVHFSGHLKINLYSELLCFTLWTCS